MKKELIVLTLVFLPLGCATIMPKSDSEILQEHQSIADLDKHLSTATANEINILAPEGFRRADELFNEAMEKARKDEEEQARNASLNGIKALEDAESAAKRTREIMWEVLEYRERAKKAGAPGVFKEEFDDIEGDFREANTLVERKEEIKAKERRPDLLKAYSELEVKTLKEGTLAIAKASFKHAEAQDAEDHAPKTFSRAKKELDLAVSILEDDPAQVEKANEYAQTADKLSQEAEQITELARTFEQRDYTHEEIILWYQQQLSEINKPLGGDLDFRQPDRKVVASLRDKVTSVVQAQKDDLEIIEKQQTRIQELQGQLLEQAKLHTEKERHEAELKQRFEYVQTLFSPEEAEVFRKGDDMLISATGFSFPVGSTMILPQSFGLMNKIINSIQQFPRSQIEVSGHTDSIGSTESNLRLSKERADNVAKFLVEVGNIELSRLRAEGYGESKPVANNETEEGRRKNRRIDVLIINQ